MTDKEQPTNLGRADGSLALTLAQIKAAICGLTGLDALSLATDVHSAVMPVIDSYKSKAV